MTIKKEDYIEPCCLLKKPSNVTQIPIGRVMDKFDEYIDKENYSAAIRHLDYWQREAEIGNDKRSKLSILNEKVGFFRKQNQCDLAIQNGLEALSLAEELGLKDSISMGTVLVNLATAYKVDEQNEKAAELYEQAKTIYEKSLDENDYKSAALNNNYGLCLMSLKNYSKAKACFLKAIEILKKGDCNEPDIAVTYCNIADCESLALDPEKAEAAIDEALNCARAFLYKPEVSHDSYFAYVADKCAQVFGYYGYFIDKQKLMKIAEDIRDRT